MRKRRNPLAQAAALLTRGVVKLVDTGVKVVNSSTRGVRDLYSEAKSEYESGRASVRTVGSPIVMPGASHTETSSSISNFSTGSAPSSGSSSAATSMAATASSVLLDYTGAPLETGSRKRGRPKKAVLVDALDGASKPASGIILSDGSPATKRKPSAAKDVETAAGKRRGRPAGSTLLAGGDGSSSPTKVPAKRGPKPGAASRKKAAGVNSDRSDPGSLLQPVSQLDGNSEAPVVPDDLTPAAGPSAGSSSESHAE